MTNAEVPADEHPADIFLRSKGFNPQSPVRHAAYQCLTCQWRRQAEEPGGPPINSHQLSKCLGENATNILRIWQDWGIITCQAIRLSGVRHRIRSIAFTNLGRKFLATIPSNQPCQDPARQPTSSQDTCPRPPDASAADQSGQNLPQAE